MEIEGEFVMFVDSHFHIGYSPNFYFYGATFEKAIESMERLNISYCMNCHVLGLTAGSLADGIRYDKEAYERSEGRIMSYFVFDPRDGRRCIETMDKYFDKRVFKGIKIHPSFHGLNADDPKYEPVWRYAKQKALPIMSHTWALSSYNPTQKHSFPPLFEGYIAGFPEVTFIFGHAGGRYEGIQKCVELVSKYENAYMDVSGDVYNNGLIEYLVGGVGSKKILFGSDTFWIDPRTQIGMILGAGVSTEDKANILYKNALRIFDIKPAAKEG